MVLALALVAACISGSAPRVAFAEDYPSWAEVEAARKSTAATQTQLGRIDAALANLETRAGELADQAIEASGAASSARAALANATATAATIQLQLDAATVNAEAATTQLGRLGAQMYRSGAGELVYRMLLTNDPDSDLLYELSVSTRLSQTTRGVEERALATQNLVRQLGAQADAAITERDRLATTAQNRADEAVIAQQAADAEVVTQQATSDVLFAQLATLKSSTADTERAYRTGVAEAEAFAAQQAAAAQKAAADKAAAAAGGSGGSGSSAGGSGSSGGSGGSSGSGGSGGSVDSGTGTAPPPAGMVVDPAGARAYAATAVAARGWGNEQYSCLVSLWNRESGWRADAYNASSGAYGIPQSLPGSKMASAGADWRTNATTQINWGLSYISARYSTPCAAWAHSESVNWY